MAENNNRYTRNPRTENLKWVDHMVYLMDNQFRFPGTKFRFGLDPILGLIPVVGDFASFGMSAVIIFTMARHGASSKLVVLMLFNSAIDFVFGSIPIVGSIFDFYFKANQRNVRMLRKYYEEGKYQGSGKNLAVIILVGFIILTILLMWALWQLVEWFYGLIISYM